MGSYHNNDLPYLTIAKSGEQYDRQCVGSTKIHDVIHSRKRKRSEASTQVESNRSEPSTIARRPP